MPLSSLFRVPADALDRRVGWDKLPLPAGILTLVGLRDRRYGEALLRYGRSS